MVLAFLEGLSINSIENQEKLTSQVGKVGLPPLLVLDRLC
jgi:hypothetical protein